MERLTEQFLIRLSPQIKKKLENDAWLNRMSMAEYLRFLIDRGTKTKKLRLN